MRIFRNFTVTMWDEVGDVPGGDVVAMKAPVNEYCKKDDLYIVGEIPGCYLRDAKGPEHTSWLLQDKIAVTNLRTGGVSLVQTSRPCRRQSDARVVI